MLVSRSAYSSTLKMEAMCFSQTLVDFQWTTWHYIPEDSTLHNHHCENLKSYRINSVYAGYLSGLQGEERKEEGRMVVKSCIFWDIMPCSPLKVNQHVTLKHRLAFNRLHSIISQKIKLFITTAVKTSNPTKMIVFTIH
jgi:hypothetical protein